MTARRCRTAVLTGVAMIAAACGESETPQVPAARVLAVSLVDSIPY
jgi:hypothetical protein